MKKILLSAVVLPPVWVSVSALGNIKDINMIVVQVKV